MSARFPAVRRRGFMMLPLAFAVLPATGLLTACSEEPPPEFRPLTFDYLPKLRLNVATVDIDSAWQPATLDQGVHVEALAPQQPADALRLMARQRLLPVGTGGHAVVTIEDASLIQRGMQYEGAMQVHLDLSTSDGARAGEAKASVNATRSIVDTGPAATRAALYELVKRMMSDMNAELEFQIRKSLHDYLQTATDTAPPAQPVQTQDLGTAKPAP